IYHQDFLRRLDEVERLKTVQVKPRNAGREAVRMRCEGELSSQNLRIVLCHALHDPGLENGGTLQIRNKVIWLLPGAGSLLIADPRVGRIRMQGTCSAGNDGKIHIEGEPPDLVRGEIRR